MAANTTFQLALYSADLQTDILDLSVTNTMLAATQGGLLRIDLGLTGDKTTLADEDQFNDTSKLFVYNASTNSGATSRIYVSFDGTNKHITLFAGEWSMMPWTAKQVPHAGSASNIVAWAETAGNTIEFGIFDI